MSLECSNVFACVLVSERSIQLQESVSLAAFVPVFQNSSVESCFPEAISPEFAEFEPEIPGNAVERLAVELPMVLRGSREGGFFVVVARREGSP